MSTDLLGLGVFTLANLITPSIQRIPSLASSELPPFAPPFQIGGMEGSTLGEIRMENPISIIFRQVLAKLYTQNRYYSPKCPNQADAMAAILEYGSCKIGFVRE